jgi:O-antigen/teichoic acid export membrane protein
MYIEVIPQAVALAATFLALKVSPTFDAVVWLSIAQAFTAVLISHLLSEGRYRLALNREMLSRQISFGWPILLSALPLIAVYQGERLIIGRLSGMESLAAYTACFMLTMVPGLLAAKAGHALMLPLFSDALRRGRALASRFKFMTEVTTLGAALYLVFFVIAGEAVLPLVFGPHYTGLGAVTAWLAAMWALRMIQAVPGMALMAAGHTKPFLIAGLVRASVLPFALWTAIDGATISTIAGIAFFGECLSLFYVGARLEALEKGTGGVLLSRALFLVPAALLAVLAQGAAGINVWNTGLALVASAAAVIGVGVAVMPSLRAQVRVRLGSKASITSVYLQPETACGAARDADLTLPSRTSA